MKVVGYISSNKKKELDRDIDLKVQKDRIKDFSNSNMHLFFGFYQEELSDREDYKPELLAMMKDAAQKKFDIVVVDKLEVISKDSQIINWVLGELKQQGVKVHSLSETILPEKLIENEDSAKKARDIRDKVRDIPSLPEVVNQVMMLAQDPNSSAAQLSKVIAHDPGLTSRVLKLVNSSYYGFPKQISSIQHAVAILGFTTMRGLVLSSSIFKIFSPKSNDERLLDYKKFWKHSLITAFVAKYINKALYFNFDEDIFSAAILHDIGKIILDQYDHENYAKAYTQVPQPMYFERILACEELYCSVNHADIGYMVADTWNLPETIQDSIRYHHSPMDADENKLISSVVHIANTLAHCILEQEYVSLSLFSSEVIDFLGLSDDLLAEINYNVKEEVVNIGDLESFFK